MGSPFEEAGREQDEAARARFALNEAERRENVEALSQPGGLAKVNAPEVIARRLDRVSRYLAGEPLPATAADNAAAAERPHEVTGDAIDRVLANATTSGAAAEGAAVAADAGEEVARGVEQAGERAGVVLEAIIGTADFIDIRYLEEGVAAARAVCRVNIRDARGRLVGYGSGSLVSPRLLLTNHHVLPSAEVAAFSGAEFNYQDGVDGKPLAPQLFQLDPQTFFVNDPTLDFALVAVSGGEQQLGPFGFNRLIEAQGKAVVGEFVTIVQHPRGEKKQIALRENRIVAELELFLHYQTDTEPGSSGSPVFNDQWELVALHHASVPDPDHAGSILNEGIRASRLIRYLADQHLTAPQQALLDQLRAPERITIAAPPQASSPSSAPQSTVSPPAPRPVGGRTLAWTLPFELHVELRAADVSAAASPALAADTAGAAIPEALVEPFRDEDFSNRRGYDPDFLDLAVPLPQLLDESVLARLDDGSSLLLYEHFSIAINKPRRLALFTASNVDASAARKEPEPGRDYSRRGLTGLGPHDQEKWFLDPRLPALSQLPDRFFTKDRKSFDKGHIVRREDVAWGDSYEELRRANGDTFHVTNCSPQVANFNRSNLKGIWGELENIVLRQARNERYCMFAGPVFRDDDRLFRGVDDDGTIQVAIPRQFWKIVIARSDEQLQSFAFLLDQDLSGTDFEFAVDKEWRSRMIALADLEQLLLLKFPDELHSADQIETSNGERVRTEAALERLTL